MPRCALPLHDLAAGVLVSAIYESTFGNSILIVPIVAVCTEIL